MPESSLSDRSARIREIANLLRGRMTLSGYQSIELPSLENADLFLTKAGDQIVEQLFTFERHGRVMALRPEFTAPAVSLYLKQNVSRVARWQFDGQVFQDGIHQAAPHAIGERHSIGAELIGAAGAAADAEIIALVADILQSLDLHDWTISIGHVGLIRQLLANFELNVRTRRFIVHHRDYLKRNDSGKASLLGQIERSLLQDNTLYPSNGMSDPYPSSTDNIGHLLGALLEATGHADTMGSRTRQDIAARLLEKRLQITENQQIEAALNFLAAWLSLGTSPDQALAEAQHFVEGDAIAETMLREWHSMFTLLRAYGVPQENLLIQTDLARTWDYYSGIVFSIQVNNQVVGGGGRYDELPRLLGSPSEVPAVGFALYVDDLLTHLPAAAANARPTIYLSAGDESIYLAIAWAVRLRKVGQGVILLMHEAERPSDAIVLHVDQNGMIWLNKVGYTLDHIENLLHTLSIGEV